MSDLEVVAAEVARDLTYAIMRFYGYTEADIAEAEAVHPGRACSEEDCYDEDGRGVHPSSYNELGGTASTVVEVVLPWLAAHVEAVRVSERVRLAGEVDAALQDERRLWYTHGHAADGEVFEAFKAAIRRAAAASEEACTR